MHIDLLATCTFGLESVVVRELDQLGYVAKPVGTGRIEFRGDARAVVDANLHLRAADRVLLKVGGFSVGGGDAGFDALFEGVKSLPWEQWMSPIAKFNVNGRCVRSTISSEPAVQRATKRAIVDRLMQAHGVRILPETGPLVSVEVALVNNQATFTLDTSGPGLHKRGYREGTPGEAALRETLAAGLVLLSVWRPGRPLVDPFCGVGTIAIEAAMLARRIPPGLMREFDAERWLDGSGRQVIDAELWAEAREDAKAQVIHERVEPTIHASDLDERSLSMARTNAQRAGVERDIHFVRRDALDLTSKVEYGSVITNPPYGVRIGDPLEIEALYRALPAVFRRLPTWSFHILSGLLEMERLFGQEASRRRKLYNAKIETTYFTFLGPKPPRVRDSDQEQDQAQGRSRSEEKVESGSNGGVEEGGDGDAEWHEHVEPRREDASAAIDEGSRSHNETRGPNPRESVVQTPAFGGLRQRDEREAADFARCLANNLRHLRKMPSRGITCYRVYERDAPDVPLIIDRYHDHYHAVEYERGGGHSRSAAQQADWGDHMRAVIARVAQVPVEQVHLKEKYRQRGLSQHERLGDDGPSMIVGEGGLRFEVNLSDYIDSGLFLDHRLTRQMVREQSEGKRLLNLFYYTGAFSVYAAAGNAASTTSVDLSNTYLDWAHRNFALNGMGGKVARDREQSNSADKATPHALIRADVLSFLDREADRMERLSVPGLYDLAVVDPPTFSNSKSTDDDWDVQHGHVELLSATAYLLSANGCIYFSTNSRRFKLDEAALFGVRFERAGQEHGLLVREISRQTVPPEYRNKRIHRCWRMALRPSATIRPPATSEPAARLQADDSDANDDLYPETSER